MVADPTYGMRRRYTVDEYELMGRVGILAEDERTELLDGEIVAMSPVSPRHAGVVSLITRQLFRSMDGDVLIRVQDPIRLIPRSEPQPDVVVCRPRRDAYMSAHPAAEDILLLVEVANTSLPVDRGIKLPIYAEQGIVEIWLVDLKAEVVHVCTDPTARGYATVRTLGKHDELVPTAIKDVRIPVSDIL